MKEEKMCNETGCSGDCSACSKASSSESLLAPANEFSKIKHVIGVVSGKGGVGKSLVTSMFAIEMKRKGYKVGILDADITGPSIPKIFGVNAKAQADERGVLPQKTKGGIDIMSINLLLDKEDSPVLWRGSIISSAVTQFWSDVVWGELDYLFVDMPPGTGDVALTVFQALPIEGIVIVTSPQELVSMIVKKAYNMAQTMNIKVLGIVENMSYVCCPDCGAEFKIFGEGKTETVADELGLDLIAQIPIDVSLAQLCDEGRLENYNVGYMTNAADIIEE